MKAIFKVTVTIAAVLLSINIVCADDEAKRGRLEDGRAFRTDHDGTQLVDYIAELEVTNEALNRRVYGLEDEVSAKNRELEKLRAGVAPERVNSLKERSIIPGGGSDKTLDKNILPVKVECPAPPKQSCPVVQCPITQCPTSQCPANDCGGQIQASTAAIRQELERTKAAMQEERNQAEGSFAEFTKTIADLRSKVANPNCPARDCSPEVGAVQARYDELAERFDQSEDTREELNEQIEQLKEQVAERSQEIQVLRTKLAAAAERSTPMLVAESQRKEDLKSPTLATVRMVPSESDEPDQRMARANLEKVAEQPLDRSIPETLRAARLRAVQSLRGDLNEEVSRVRGLQQQRDNNYTKFKNTKAGVKVGVTKAESSKGRDLMEINQAAKNATSVGELAQLRREVAEIKAKMQDDMATMSRLSKRN
jgi:uncharacterized coiled-coil DUF342 family protein